MPDPFKDVKIIELMELFDDDEVTTADKIDRPEKAIERQAIDDFMERNPKAGGGMLVQPSADGRRPEYAPKKGHKEEKAKLLNWIENNKNTFDFSNKSSRDVAKASKVDLHPNTIANVLADKGIQTKTAIAKTQDRPKYTKKVLEELREGLPRGISLEQTRPGQYYFKVLLKGKKVNKPNVTKSMVANETNKKEIIDFFNKKVKEYYPGRITDDEFKKLRLEKKDMTTEQFSKFLNSKNKTTYLGEKWNPSSVSTVQRRLNVGKGTTGPQTVRTFEEVKTKAKTYPGGKVLLKSGASESVIRRFVANKISQEKLGLAGGKKGFPVGTTKENKMWRNFYNSALKENGRIRLITKIPRDADGDINWKMKDKDGVHAWKKAKFFDNKTGATYTWGGNYKPGDLAKQVDAAYGKGFFAKSVKVYDDQAAFNKQTFKGRSLNEIFREGLLKKELEIKLDRPLTNSKADKELLKDFYAVRKPSFSFTEAHHVEGVGPNPFRMEVSYRAANRAQNDLLNSFNAGNISKAEYAEGMERLSDTKGGIRYKTGGRFIGTTATPESIVKAVAQDINMKGSQINAVISSLENSDQIRLARIGCPGKATGGRVGYFEGQNLTACAIKGAERIKNDPINLTGGDQQNLRALGKSAKAVRFLKNFLGPAAIAGELIFEGGFAANKFMSEGVPLKQALGESYINKYILGPKTQIDVEAERAKEFAKGEEFAMAERGRRMAPFMAQSATADAQRLKKREEEMKALYPQFSDQELIDMIKDRGFNPQDIINQKTTTRITPAVTSTLTGLDQLRTAFQEQDALQRIADAGGIANLAGGGLAKQAGDRSGAMLESMNPDSQGLQGLLNRGNKI